MKIKCLECKHEEKTKTYKITVKHLVLTVVNSYEVSRFCEDLQELLDKYEVSDEI